MTFSYRCKSPEVIGTILSVAYFMSFREREGLSLFNYTRLRKKGVEATDSCILQASWVSEFVWETPRKDDGMRRSL
jgi:hypothetical protein